MPSPWNDGVEFSDVNLTADMRQLKTQTGLSDEAAALIDSVVVGVHLQGWIWADAHNYSNEETFQNKALKALVKYVAALESERAM